ncbi:hypothetical protein AN964_21035 [Heyndrickxia shackletonii]|uniref:LiaF transmembrane domain-containing protein n=1 Tax=Heyndrickxia shackletonii TaxID=157838 RepID=A0A0Q3WTJ8_9BACI|nr:hypothetical protein [Heyndrickxia shackletonii]KQL51453.1 hypothetical protein AN964_21035 [Heyndrickxia shackletonii]NEZ00799.1 hypothetical protein [Heyndrickxia shackletonii]
MKSWRVGSISMGAALVFLGMFLLLSQVLHWNIANVLIAWWPLLLIILGIEILLSLYFSKHDKPIVKYDILSIFFIGIIGMCGIAFTIFSSTGILNKVTYAMAAETKTLDLPKYNKTMDNHIKRIVVETQNQPVTIESTKEKSISAFGTYTAETVENHSAIKTVDDYLMLEEKGDTVYLKLKDGPNQHDPFSNGTQVSATVLIPENVRLEVEGSFNPITLKVRNLSNNWYLNSLSDVTIQVMGKPDLLVDANQADQLSGDSWIEMKEKGHNGDIEKKSGKMTFGDGTHHIVITKSSAISVTHLP